MRLRSASARDHENSVSYQCECEMTISEVERLILFFYSVSPIHNLSTMPRCCGNCDVSSFLSASLKSLKSKPGDTVQPSKIKYFLSINSAENQSTFGMR